MKLRLFRFSLRSLVLLSLLVGSAALLYRNWEPWACVRVFKCTRPITSAEFSADERTILTFSPGPTPTNLRSKPILNETRVWSVESAEPVAQITFGVSGGFCNSHFVCGGKYVKSYVSSMNVGGGSACALFNPATGEKALDGDEYDTAELSLDQHRLLTVSLNTNVIKVWNLETGKPFALPPLAEGHGCVALSPDGRRVFTASLKSPATDFIAATYQGQIFDADNGNPVIQSLTLSVTDRAQFSSDGGLLAVWPPYDFTKRQKLDGLLFDAHLGKFLESIEFSNLECSPDGHSFLYLTKSLHTVMRQMKIPTEDINAFPEKYLQKPYSPDGKFFVTFTNKGTDDDYSYSIHLRNAASGDKIAGKDGIEMRLESAGGMTVLWRNDILATMAHAYGVGDGQWWVWNYKTGECCSHQGSGDISGDGERMVRCSGEDPQIQIRRPLQATPIAVLKGHTAGVWMAKFTKDGKRILTAGEDCTARIWERRRVEAIGGLLMLPELWLTVLLAPALLWSLRRDWRELRSPTKSAIRDPQSEIV